MERSAMPGRVTLADFRALQHQLLQMKQQVYDSVERERRATEELRRHRQATVSSVTPSSPLKSQGGGKHPAQTHANGKATCYPTELNPFESSFNGSGAPQLAAASPSVASAATQTEPWQLTRGEDQLMHLRSAQAINSGLKQELLDAHSKLEEARRELSMCASEANRDPALQLTRRGGAAPSETPVSERDVSQSLSSPLREALTAQFPAAGAAGIGGSCSTESPRRPDSPNGALQLLMLQERHAAVERSVRQLRRSRLRLVFHGWRAAHANTCILRNMSSIAVHLSRPTGRAAVALPDSTLLPGSCEGALKDADTTVVVESRDSSLEMSAAVRCVSEELRRCEGDIHAQALRKAELCSRLWQQLDDCQVHHAFELQVDLGTMGDEISHLEESAKRSEEELCQARSTLRELAATMQQSQRKAMQVLGV